MSLQENRLWKSVMHEHMGSYEIPNMKAATVIRFRELTDFISEFSRVSSRKQLELLQSPQCWSIIFVWFSNEAFWELYFSYTSRNESSLSALLLIPFSLKSDKYLVI